ncbi:DNA-directed DNA polymerase III PolC [Sphaerochaeta pleomorpha str. Grapes]|uniref:DNA-directed DNA polymerase n=1 Tax=Sphaerochaeta pleomorpha (strain ATCC BAA-1885 / DSM 22778 / Grapes) TaxID=158190 RepID=G8QUT3_SPHPG|nr:DNA polymerase III subunit alpha [Sphaerochaeta pleomorpha]AEV28109.1 DNA-directed DNA polymerase III PolC [Sphaerochaeta pleomorpha str. Grapes]
MSSRLGIRSSYSLLWGTAPIQKLFETLQSQGCKSVAITDRDNLYGFPACREAAKEAGIRLICGCELLCSQGSVFAFVQDSVGFSRLCELLTERNKDRSFDYLPSLAKDSAGLVLASFSSDILTFLKGTVVNLYAAISPRCLSSIPTARSLHLPLIALDDATFLQEEDRLIHSVLRAIATGKTVGTLAAEDQEGKGGVLLDEKAYRKAFSSWPEAVSGTEKVASLCTVDPFSGELIFPDYPTPGSTAQAELRKRVLRGAEQRYGELSDGILDRIEYELDIINRKGFASYFLVMHDIVAMSSRTCGRGSAAASIVSYSLYITNVDPIAYKLYFERFLSMARIDPPDIDVDFAWDERDGVFQQVFKRFGFDHCARVANHNSFRLRSAVRETARSYGIPDSQITQMEHRLFLTGLKDVSDPLWHTICSISRQMVGLPKELSMHCGGLVITPKKVSCYAPIGLSSVGYPLLSWEKEGAEAAGFVKIDLLGNRSLAVIRDALANLQEEGITIDETTWHPTMDRATVAALARGDSLGVFYIESPAMRQLQKKTGKGDFDHIVIHSSIIRPAANKYINEYVERLKGKPWKALHPRLAYILDETYGILCYQEDVSKTAVALASFNETDADALRKVIAKKAGGAKLARYERQFFEGCKANGIEEQTVKEVWAMMLSFDGYSFCKPHSASYAMVSFQSAYLRVHHPSAFMAAVLSNQGGYYRPHAYISEARRMGLSLVGPDINQSRVAYFAREKTLIIGLMAIANLSRTAMQAIIDERDRGGRFSSLEEVSPRLSLSRDDFVALAAAGAFDSLAPSLPRSEQLKQLLITSRKSEPFGQGDLFAKKRMPIVSKTKQMQGRITRTEDELHREYEALGFLTSYHPLVLWSKFLAPVKRILACDLSQHVNYHVNLIGWQVTQKEVMTKDGKSMGFVSFEDETALYEAVLFPDMFTRYYPLLCTQWPLEVFGLVQEDHGALCVQVISLKQVGRSKEVKT